MSHSLPDQHSSIVYTIDRICAPFQGHNKLV
jgi:hypothetical protein